MSSSVRPPIGEIAELVRARLAEPPSIHLVLGSGLGHLSDRVSGPRVIGFEELPGFPRVGVEGHRGAFVAGTLGGVPVLLQAGRAHFYEGHDPWAVVAPIRVARRLGADILILTNAAGGIRRDLEPGDLMVVDDHLNLQFRSPLAGSVQEGEIRFPDMSAPYDPGLQAVAVEVGLEAGVRLARGTYAGLLGPAYETPAEIRMLEGLGADAVGMSTVPEVTAARAAGSRVLAISLITNRAAGLSGRPLSHAEVTAEGQRAGAVLGRLLELLVARLGLEAG